MGASRDPLWPERKPGDNLSPNPIYRRPVRSDFPQAALAALSTLRTDPMLTLELWVYRAYGYLMVNVVEDPAWLALVFC